MRDKQGVLRSECSQCACKEYQTPANGHACDYCGHYPVAHREGAAATAPTSSPAPHQQHLLATPPVSPHQAPAPQPQPQPQPQRPASAREQYTPTMPSVAVTSKTKPKQHKNPIDWLHEKTKKKRS